MDGRGYDDICIVVGNGVKGGRCVVFYKLSITFMLYIWFVSHVATHPSFPSLSLYDVARF